VSPRPHAALEELGFEGNGGNSYTGHLVLPKRPDGYSSPPGYLFTANITLKNKHVNQPT